MTHEGRRRSLLDIRFDDIMNRVYKAGYSDYWAHGPALFTLDRMVGSKLFGEMITEENKLKAAIVLLGDGLIERGKRNDA